MACVAAQHDAWVFVSTVSRLMPTAPRRASHAGHGIHSVVAPAQTHLSPATPWCAHGTCDWSLKFSITVSTLAGMSCTYRSMTMTESAASCQDTHCVFTRVRVCLSAEDCCKHARLMLLAEGHMVAQTSGDVFYQPEVSVSASKQSISKTVVAVLNGAARGIG